MAAHAAEAGRTAIEYVSYADAIGYGQAAIGYVGLLRGAGFAVHWRPFLNDALWAEATGPAMAGTQLARAHAALRLRGQAAGRNDLAALIDATDRPVRADLRILHLMPPFWAAQLGYDPTGCPHIGMTVWETDSIAASWLPMLCAVDHLIVPSTHNARVLEAARVGGANLPPVSVVPHLCRPDLRPPPQPRLDALAAWAGIRPGDTVFYSINAWDPRKRMSALIDGFARAFHPDDPAVLLVKTGRTAPWDDPAAPTGSHDVEAIVAAILARAAAETGRPPGRIAVLARDEVADTVIDGFHALGDCFVSLSRCEGFGLGAFDAATHGRPVIAVGYGGPVDYLGEDWPGRIPHRMVPCEPMPGIVWFDASQSWPEPDDAAAFAHMRRFVGDPAPYRAAAATTADRIRRDFGAEAITARLQQALAQIVPRGERRRP